MRSANSAGPRGAAMSAYDRRPTGKRTSHSGRRGRNASTSRAWASAARFHGSARARRGREDRPRSSSASASVRASAAAALRSASVCGGGPLCLPDRARGAVAERGPAGRGRVEPGEDPVLDLGHPREIPGTLFALRLHAQLVDLPLDVGDALQRLLLARPARGELVADGLRVGQLTLDRLAGGVHRELEEPRLSPRLEAAGTATRCPVDAWVPGRPPGRRMRRSRPPHRRRSRRG